MSKQVSGQHEGNKHLWPTDGTKWVHDFEEKENVAAGSALPSCVLITLALACSWAPGTLKSKCKLMVNILFLGIPLQRAVSICVQRTTPECCRLSGGTVSAAQSPGGSDWRAFTAWPSKPQPWSLSSSGSWHFHTATRRCIEKGAWGVGSFWPPAWVWSLSQLFHLWFRLRLRLWFRSALLFSAPLCYTGALSTLHCDTALQFSRATVTSSRLCFCSHGFLYVALFSGQPNSFNLFVGLTFFCFCFPLLFIRMCFWFSEWFSSFVRWLISFFLFKLEECFLLIGWVSFTLNIFFI